MYNHSASQLTPTIVKSPIWQADHLLKRYQIVAVWDRGVFNFYHLHQWADQDQQSSRVIQDIQLLQEDGWQAEVWISGKNVQLPAMRRALGTWLTESN